jgi:autotransporter-associated beta strand protein
MASYARGRASRWASTAVALAASLLAYPTTARAQSTWTGPGSDWNTATDWSTSSVPTGTAIFTGANPTSVIFLHPGTTTIGVIQFNAGAPNYGFTLVERDTAQQLTVNGTGIVNSAVGAPTFTLDVGGTLDFQNSATAANANITMHEGTLLFQNFSTAGSAIVTAPDSMHIGFVEFENSASAGSAHFTMVGSTGLPGQGTVEFLDASTAANATFINNPGLGAGGTTQFGSLGGSDTSNAGSAQITNNSNGSAQFYAHTSASSAMITNNSGGFTVFRDESTAANATIVNSGGTTYFGLKSVGTDTATAGNANITNNSGGSTNFNASTTAGNAIITTNNGGSVTFFDSSTGGNASFITNAGGKFDISGLTSAGMTAGSIAGAGNYYLGSKTLTVGGNGFSTTVSGVISDAGGAVAGVGGSLIKVGGGTLILSGLDTYTGGTGVEGGALQLDHATTVGSVTTIDAAGTGPIVVTSGGLLELAVTGALANELATAGAGSTGIIAATTGTTTTLTGQFLPAGGSIAFGSGSDNGTIVFAPSTVSGGTPFTTLEVAGGTLQAGAGNAGLGGLTAGAGATQIDAAATLDFNGESGPAATIANLTGSGTLTNSTGAITVVNSGNFSGVIAGAGGLEISPGVPTPATLTLSNANNSYTGVTQIDAGATLALTGAGSIADSLYVAFAGAGTLDISQTTAGAAVAGLFDPFGSGVVALGAQTLTITNNVGPFDGVIADGGVAGGAGGNLTIANGGLASLGGINTYTGLTTINAGGELDLVVGAQNGSIAKSSGVVDNGIFDISGIGNGTTPASASIATLSGTNSGAFVYLGLNSLTITNASGAFAGTIADGGSYGGTGGSLVIAGGVEKLTGANTYTGSTTVSGGVLQVDGSLASPTVTVTSGGTLAGTGTLAGVVTIASGGTLSPGDAPGTITLGSLTLNSGSILAYQLGTPNVVGGTTNDLTVVNGPLTINGGTLNVTNSGSFGLGVYQIIDYTGALGGNGQLTVGTLPNGDIGVIQTSIPGEVNLVVSGPGALTQFWDGATTAGDGTIHGGSGTWNNSTTNWTTPNGAINASWQGGVAVFAGAAGTVTISEPVAYQGLQFATTGYTVTATGSGALTPTGVASVIVGGGLTATISAPIVGTGGLQITGAGTLALTGTNSYSGGTTLSAGTLQANNANGLTSSSVGTGAVAISNGAIFQSLASGLNFANAFTLNGVGGQIETTTNPGDTLTLSGLVSGSGGLSKIGMNGTLILTDANTYSGGTEISQGIVQATNANGSTSSSVGTGTVYLAGGVFQAGANNLTFANAFGLDAAGTPTASDGGARIDTNGFTLTLAGVLSDGNAIGLGGTGPGALAKHGAGELILTNANTYSGGTYLFGGTIGVGNSAALGTGTLSMQAGTTLQATANNLTLGNAIALTGADTIDAQTNAFTLAGAITGTGSLAKIGSGELTLTAANSYSGGTLLNAGTLGVGNSAALGTGPLTMQDGTVLQFTAPGLNLANAIIFPGADPTIDTQGANETISGVISGTGGLTKIGAGSLDLTATNTYTGATTISAGALVVDGSIASSSSLTLASGTTLGGSGVVPGFVVPSGATIAPGALTPFSTLHVAGTIGFLAGSAYTIDINPAGANDKIVATGAAALSGGTVNIVAATGSYSTANRYTILTASGGVTGAFASLTTTSNFAFLTPTLAYDADDVYLGFAQKATFPSVAIAPNQVATATAIQAQGAGAPIFDDIINQSAAGARQAFDALSGEIHASVVSSAFDDSRLPREAVLDRLSNPYGTLSAVGGAAGFAAMNAMAGPSVPANLFAGWGQAFGSFGHIGGDGNAATVDRSMGGFILGLDATIDARYRLGVAAGYTQSNLSVAARASSGQIDSTYAGLYGGASLDALQLRGGGFYAFNRYGTDRSIMFPGFADTASSSYGGDTLQGFAESGWRMPISGFAGPTFLEPIVGVMAMHIDTAAFSEAGAAGASDPAALTGAARGYDYAATTLGVRAEATVFANMPLLLRGMVGWTHVFGDVTPTSTLAFESAPSIPFAIAGAPVARDALAIEAGFDWKLTRNATVGVFYSGSLGERDQDNAIKGKLEATF